MGIAFWPGGRVEDWLPAYDSGTKAFGLNPCNATNDFNKTALSDAQYLVSQCRLLKSAWCLHSSCQHCCVLLLSKACQSTVQGGCHRSPSSHMKIPLLCALQTQRGVVVAPFEVVVDTLMSLRINASDIASLFNNISTASDIPDVISAVVFRCASEVKVKGDLRKANA